MSANSSLEIPSGLALRAFVSADEEVVTAGVLVPPGVVGPPGVWEPDGPGIARMLRTSAADAPADMVAVSEI